MQIKVGMVSLGCAKNQVDAERMLAILRRDGFVLSPDAGVCDVVIVNTCGFIEDAKRESIENILEFAALKETGALKAVVVTGCLAERYQKEIAGELPEVDVILGIGKNNDISRAIRGALKGERTVAFGDKASLSLEGERILTNAPYYAYLKVADGCGNRCSYCAIPLIRGDFRSRRMEDVVAEAKELGEQGVTELNVVAQDTTRYGEDIYGELMLPRLLEELCALPGIHWVRILYCYPQRITDELLEVMARQPKIVHYMDMPVQHASGRVLAEMNRRGDAESLTSLVEKIRRKIPDIALRTTFITGFPGETEEDFEELCLFVQKNRFDRLGCFAYSQEEDTPAAGMEPQLDGETKRRRAEIVMELQMRIAEVKGEESLGRTLEVLCEGYDRERGLYFGRSYMDAPDIDTKVYFSAGYSPEPGNYLPVTITEAMDYDLIGEAQ